MQSLADILPQKINASRVSAPAPSPTSVRPAPSPAGILQLGFAFWGSKTLLSAVELGLFTELARQPGTLDQLTQRLNLHSRGARDFLDALVAFGFLQRENGVYSNTQDTDLFLDRQKPSYIGGILEMANARLYPYWGNLTEALQTGVPQNEAKSGQPDIFAELYSDPQRLKQFLQAMTGVSRGANVAIAQVFPWANYQTFVDAGTAEGDLAGQIALANPHLRGVGFDLPKVGPIFEEYVEKLGVSSRLRFTGGDFFQQPLPKAEVILMGHILHDWDLTKKKHLIRAAWDALPKGGALIIYDAIIDDDRRTNSFGLLMSLNMLIETPGGFDYTGAECCAWLREVGFREVSVKPLIGADSMVVGIK